MGDRIMKEELPQNSDNYSLLTSQYNTTTQNPTKQKKQRLYLDDNSLRSLPNEIVNLTKLTWLSIDRNSVLSFLPFFPPFPFPTLSLFLFPSLESLFSLFFFFFFLFLFLVDVNESHYWGIFFEGFFSPFPLFFFLFIISFFSKTKKKKKKKKYSGYP